MTSIERDIMYHLINKRSAVKEIFAIEELGEHFLTDLKGKEGFQIAFFARVSGAPGFLALPDNGSSRRVSCGAALLRR